ncbi:MAG: hypothetical protein OXH48_01705, partial [Chloroflexi bacterium]|nr:hypothetical protein [Chloroflexota bacterium]
KVLFQRSTHITYRATTTEISTGILPQGKEKRYGGRGTGTANDKLPAQVAEKKAAQNQGLLRPKSKLRIISRKKLALSIFGL